MGASHDVLGTRGGEFFARERTPRRAQHRGVAVILITPASRHAELEKHIRLFDDGCVLGHVESRRLDV